METIKRLRERAGLQQKEAAEKLGVSASCFCYWENGRREPNARQMAHLCEVLACTPGELLGIETVYPRPGLRVQEAELPEMARLLGCTVDELYEPPENSLLPKS